jgi:hypothetical protein
MINSTDLASVYEDKQIRRDEIPAVLTAIRQETKQGGLLAAACVLQQRIARNYA